MVFRLSRQLQLTHAGPTFLCPFVQAVPPFASGNRHDLPKLVSGLQWHTLGPLSLASVSYAESSRCPSSELAITLTGPLYQSLQTRQVLLIYNHPDPFRRIRAKRSDLSRELTEGL